MSENDEKKNDDQIGLGGSEALFTQLVLSFQAAAWQQMGKVQSIMTGKIERNLVMAKHSIDMLAMLEEKTNGNLTEDETKYLKHVLYELRMNYLEEVKKGPDKKEEEESPAPSEAEDEKPASDDSEKQEK
jgi:hypothetical protein